MSRLKLAATAAAILGGLAVTSGAQAFTFVTLSPTGQLSNYNSATGASTAIATDAGLVGLGQLNSTVYGETSLGQLYSISSAGVESPIGSANLTGATSYVDFGSTTGALYGLGNNGDLYTIDRTSGAGVFDLSLGLTGAQLTNLTSARNLIGMSTGSSTLYFVDGTTMYVINTTTNVVTTHAIGAGPTQFGALMYLTAAQAGSAAAAGLYGGANSTNLHGKSVHSGLYKFDLSTYAETLVNETTPNNTNPFFMGMVPGFTTKVLPEPSEWALMLVGFGAIGGALRSRRRRAIAQA